MGRSVPHNLKSTHQTEFVKIFNSLCGRYGRWEIWQDFVTLAAIAISNTVDRSQAAEREKTYMTIAGKYKPDEMLKFSQMLQEVVVGMDFNPDQDFLGELYMELDLGNDHAGQFFTPYDVCRMMAEITGTDLQARVERDGWISVNDALVVQERCWWRLQMPVRGRKSTIRLPCFLRRRTLTTSLA